MKYLNIVKSAPDGNTQLFMDAVSEGRESTVFNLYDETADYDALIDAIFEHDRVISWW
ncbi:MAG: hypothetical protein JRK53_14465 [Deltaproteobacteria bacterium]|nr:hypothetical protein [Deltaproteobacteria bacterium]MBW1818581.1 hypothetical protein [Deltaproteobacteria bacterium]